MTTAAPERPARASAAASLGRVGPALTGLVVRQVRRGALVVIVLTGGMSALVAGLYRSTFAGEANGPALRELAASPAVRVLFGPPLALDDPGGFTVWRTGALVAVVLGVWALLVATRLTRGEEEAGRWNLLLAGRTSAAAMVGRSLAVVSVAVFLTGVAIGAAMIAAGAAATGAVLHAAAVAGVGLCFAALGTLAAQILPSRAAASGVTVAVLGAALLARMIADGVAALSWLRWVSPFGLAAEVRPFAGDHPAPLAALVLAPAVLGALAVVTAGRRDVDAGLVGVRSRRRAHTRLLRSAATFAVRRTLRPLSGWALGIGAYFLLVSLLADAVSRFLTESPQLAEFVAAAGFAELGLVRGFVGVMFSLLAVPVGVYPATRLAAAAADETSRRSTLLAAAPLSRLGLAGAEFAVAVAGVLVLLTVAAFAVWAGTAAAGVPVALGDSLAGAGNVMPIALLGLGAAMLAWGWSPVGVAAVGSIPAAGGFGWLVLAQSVGAPRWLVDLSPFAHLAPVPFTEPDWVATVTLTALAAGLAGLGLIGYRRRDLHL